MTKGKKILLVLGGLLGLSWGVYECKYYFSYYSDLQTRPWAYSRDQNAKLLVGKWQGAFKDPNGVSKTLEIEIFEPVSEEERQKKAIKRARRRSGRENKRAFEGMATVKSRLGQEEYEIYGAVEKEDFHKLSFNFRPQDEAKRILPNFTLLEANPGSWETDNLLLTLSFSRQNADGSSSSSSEGVVKNGKIEWQESKDNQKIRVSLKRIKL